MNIDLRSRVAVVTGGTAGIGLATARALVRAGAAVVIAGRRRELGRAVAADLDSLEGPGSSWYGWCDLHDPAATADLFADVVDRHGRLDIAFNNAGIFDRSHLLHDYDDEAWDTTISLNLSAVFRCMKHELTAMLVNDPPGGVIVNNASTVAHRGSERAGPAYVAAKHGVLGLTRQAAVQYATSGIRVNAVSPGPTATDVSAPLVAEGEDAVRQTLAALNPTARFVSPDEVAGAVLYLCSDAAASVNGQDIVLDGGQLATL